MVDKRNKRFVKMRLVRTLVAHIEAINDSVFEQLQVKNPNMGEIERKELEKNSKIWIEGLLGVAGMKKYEIYQEMTDGSQHPLADFHAKNGKEAISKYLKSGMDGGAYTENGTSPKARIIEGGKIA